MEETAQERRWFWATLVLSCLTIVGLVFAFWELVENSYFHDLDYVALHYLYVSRGVASSLLLATWAAWFVMRQRRVAEEQLRRSRERYRGLLQASPEAVVLYDGDFRVYEWNAAAERLYGFSREEAMAMALPTIAREEEEELRQCMQQAAKGEPVLDRETVRVDKQGTRLNVQLSLIPFREPQQQLFLEVASDISERVRLRERLLELEKLTTMGKMAAGTAHHLNTPLASMLLRVQMMRQRADAAAQDELQHLEEALLFCQQFVRRLLDFSRRPTSQRQPEDLASVVAAVLGFLAPSFSARNVSVTASLEPPRGWMVMADPNQLEMLLLILLSNALDAVSSGGHIAITCVSQDEQFRLNITDDGCGISEAEMARIFEPFFTTKPLGKGTGLGLAIAKTIATEHGGDLWLERAPGRGIRAVVELPPCAEVRVLQEVSP